MNFLGRLGFGQRAVFTVVSGPILKGRQVYHLGGAANFLNVVSPSLRVSTAALTPTAAKVTVHFDAGVVMVGPMLPLHGSSRNPGLPVRDVAMIPLLGCTNIDLVALMLSFGA